MDANKFTENKTGNLVEITIPGLLGDERDCAFIPDSLPTTYEVSQELWPMLAKAMETLARLDTLCGSLPNPLLLINPIQRREALQSSSLEGTFSTPEELMLFELDAENESSDLGINSQREVNNYAVALREGVAALGERPFSLTLVRELHRWLLTNTRGEDKGPGQVRDTQVHIGSSRRFIPPPPLMVNDCLEDFESLLKSISVEHYSGHPLIACFMLHYQFETIHPFRDGNGRVGRLILALTIWKWCDHDLPWLYMSPFFEKYKDEYIAKLFNVSAKGDWTDWLKFCLKGTVDQAQDTINRVKELTSLKENMIARLDINNTIRLVNLIEYLFNRPLLTTPVASRLCQVSYPTARQDILTLEKMGILTRTSKTSKPIRYMALDIYNIIFRESI
jgi:Fic family protein